MWVMGYKGQSISLMFIVPITSPSHDDDDDDGGGDVDDDADCNGMFSQP